MTQYEYETLLQLTFFVDYYDCYSLQEGGGLVLLLNSILNGLQE
jgi:hypothetical protein